MIELAPGIYFTEDPAAAIADLLSGLDYSRLVIIDDENTSRECYPFVEDVLEGALHITIAAGEEHKTLATCQGVWEQMTEANIDRKAVVINLGGGVVGDLGGFCAATYKRGIRFINIPTTLLAQVDASIGGKQGIDFMDFKNQIGVFQNPLAVIINPGFLETLSIKEKISGFAEIVKHALINDQQLWDELGKHNFMDNLKEIIPKAIKIKHKIVADDPLEKSVRKLLNFGHTLGHALESYLLSRNQRKILHGEAVAAGMIMESWLSWQLGYLKKEEFLQIELSLNKIFPAVDYEQNEIEAISSLLFQDKKNENGELRYSLLDGVGKGKYNIPVSQVLSKRALEYYQDYQNPTSKEIFG